jgi:hypothetical protein
VVVVPDGGSHGQDALGDADGDAFEGAKPVSANKRRGYQLT